MVLVDTRVEEAVVCGVPDAAAAGVRHVIAEILAGLDVAHAQAEKF